MKPARAPDRARGLRSAREHLTPGQRRFVGAINSYAMCGDRERGLDAGCSGAIEEPIDPVTFVAQLRPFFDPAPIPGAAP